MGIGRDEGARVLAFCTNASRRLHFIQVRRCTVVLSKDGINCQVLDNGIVAELLPSLNLFDSGMRSNVA